MDRLQLCRAGLLIRVGACLASIVSGDGVYLAVQSISLAYAFIIHSIFFVNQEDILAGSCLASIVSGPKSLN